MPQLEDFIALARAAGREIMAVRLAGFDAETKQDGSIVTIADQRAEAVIEDGLRRLAPDVPMLGEEACAAGRIPECGDLFFCVDPLDGTRGFAKGGDEFTVNIALVRNGAPEMGVVFAPASGELYAGEPGRVLRAYYDPSTGAELKPLAPIRASAPQRPLRVIVSDFSGRNERTAAFIETLGGVPAHASSSIKFCRLAEGAADLYPRFGEVSEWDAAAGHAVLSAAGGGIVRLDGTPLRYGNAADAFLIRGFLAYASEAGKEVAQAALR